MSARAAWRLETLGFAPVYRYAAGKVDWLASGLPFDGRLAQEARIQSLADATVSTCRPGERLGEVRDRVQGDLCVVLGPERVVLGTIRGKALSGEGDALIEDVMNPAPVTYRPNTSVRDMAHYMAESGARRVLVTTADGELVGVLRLEDVEHALHAAHGGGPVLASHGEHKEVAG